MACSKRPTSPSATATQPRARSASCGRPPRERPSSTSQRWCSCETSETPPSTPPGSYLPDCAYMHFKSYLLPTQATKNYFFKRKTSFWFFFSEVLLSLFFFFKQRFKVFYFRKPCNSEQIKLCCTIVLAGAIDCGGWGRCLHVDAQRPP